MIEIKDICEHNGWNLDELKDALMRRHVAEYVDEQIEYERKNK